MKQRSCWRAALLILTILLLAGGVVLASSSNAQRVLYLVSQGGEKQLRDPLRPIRGETRALVIALDGVGANRLDQALDEGRMPHLAGMFGERQNDHLFQHAYAAPETVTLVPSITKAVWPAMFAGQPPAMTGTAGNEWYDRAAMAFRAPAPATVEPYDDFLRIYAGGLFGELVPVSTIFEDLDLRSHVAHLQLHRGADILNLPRAGDIPWILARMLVGVHPDTDSYYGVFAALDEAAADNAIGSMRDHGIPDLQVVYFAGVDLYTHVSPAPEAAMLDFLEQVIDPKLGELFAFYRDQGALDDTFVVVVSDHGHVQVPNDERHALGARDDNNPKTLIENSGYRLRDPELGVAEDTPTYQVVIAYNGPIAYLYLADRSTCPQPDDVCDWRAAPRLEEDVLPLARAFHAANQSGAGLPGITGAIDLILARAGRPVGEDALPFEVFDGERLIPMREYLAQNPRPELMRFEERMEWLAAGPLGHNAGDIVLIARNGGAVPLEERFYFRPAYYSLHGSPDREDSHVPLVVAHPRRSGDELRELVSQAVSDPPSVLDVAPLLQRLLAEPWH